MNDIVIQWRSGGGHTTIEASGPNLCLKSPFAKTGLFLSKESVDVYIATLQKARDEKWPQQSADPSQITAETLKVGSKIVDKYDSGFVLEIIKHTGGLFRTRSVRNGTVSTTYWNTLADAAKDLHHADWKLVVPPPRIPIEPRMILKGLRVLNDRGEERFIGRMRSTEGTIAGWYLFCQASGNIVFMGWDLKAAAEYLNKNLYTIPSQKAPT